jgi:hypothetical protein
VKKHISMRLVAVRDNWPTSGASLNRLRSRSNRVNGFALQ